MGGCRRGSTTIGGGAGTGAAVASMGAGSGAGGGGGTGAGAGGGTVATIATGSGITATGAVSASIAGAIVATGSAVFRSTRLRTGGRGDPSTLLASDISESSKWLKTRVGFVVHPSGHTSGVVAICVTLTRVDCEREDSAMLGRRTGHPLPRERKNESHTRSLLIEYRRFVPVSHIPTATSRGIVRAVAASPTRQVCKKFR